jgi:hypothetical protein
MGFKNSYYLVSSKDSWNSFDGSSGNVHVICLNQGVPCPIIFYLFHLSCPNLGHEFKVKVAIFNFTYHIVVLQLTLHQIQNQFQIGHIGF